MTGARGIRVAFITNFCPYYRRPLFEALAATHDVDFYFFSEARDRFCSGRIAPEQGLFREVQLRRVWIGRDSLMPELAKLLTRDRYDVVVKCLNGRLMVPWVFGLARRARLPIVLWTGMWHHPRSVFHRGTQSLTEAIYRRADAIVAYGEHVRRFLSDVQGVDADRIYVAGQAVESSRFLSVSAELVTTPTVAYVGQLEEQKGLRDLLTAYDRLRDTGIHLAVAGGGALAQEVEARAARDPQIHHLGHISQEDVPGVLERARCLALPSITTKVHREPWGLVVNEAMHAARPVVATTAVGAAAGGLVVDGRNGHIVPERCPRGLANALRLVCADKEHATELGVQARTDVERFSYAAMHRAFGDAIDMALGGGTSK